jgi:hypothetical protein
MNRAFSFGGGRQSTAALVLAARGELDVDVFVFANVGDDAENPDTLEYVKNHSKPYAEAHGLKLVEVQRKFRDGRDPSLRQQVLRQAHGAVIPMRGSLKGAPFKRNCTVDWKIRVVVRYLKQELGWRPPWEQMLGISWDESHRIHDPETLDDQGYVRRYPLCDLKVTVSDCKRIVADAGLPPPPRSACWFCPFHTLTEWAKLRMRRPDLFEASVELERIVSERTQRDGQGPSYMTPRLKPLNVVVPEGAEQIGMFEDEPCTSGYCWT